MRVTTQQVTFSAPSDMLNDDSLVCKTLDEIVKACGLTKVSEQTHHFTPQGLSTVYILSESHIAVHTWPEHNYAYITLSSCAAEQADIATFRDILESMMQGTDISIQTIAETAHV